MGLNIKNQETHKLVQTLAKKTGETDRKSTRLNSSHLVISYAVFCLKKKKQIQRAPCAEQSISELPRPGLGQVRPLPCRAPGSRPPGAVAARDARPTHRRV